MSVGNPGSRCRGVIVWLFSHNLFRQRAIRNQPLTKVTTGVDSAEQSVRIGCCSRWQWPINRRTFGVFGGCLTWTVRCPPCWAGPRTALFTDCESNRRHTMRCLRGSGWTRQWCQSVCNPTGDLDCSRRRVRSFNPERRGRDKCEHPVSDVEWSSRMS